MSPYAPRYVWPEDLTKSEKHSARAAGRKQILESADGEVHPAEILAATCECVDCRRPPQPQHVEHEGPLRVPLIRLLGPALLSAEDFDEPYSEVAQGDGIADGIYELED